MIVLGIESTCDETACALVRDGKEILGHVVSSQMDLHSRFGGVVPELACRRHVDLIIPVIQECLSEANLSLDDVDLFSFARGPGLIGALLIGNATVKGLAMAKEKPFIGVSHIEGHLYAALMCAEEYPKFPCLGLVLSGGHSSLVLVEGIGSYHALGQTIDDAIGEAFDKVARMMGLPYPGGPAVEKLGVQGDPERYPFRGAKMKDRPLDFSFSGLKTKVRYTLCGQDSSKNFNIKIPREDLPHVAASFQEAAFVDVIQKTKLAAGEHGVKTVLIGGGVSQNKTLRRRFAELAPELNLLWPTPELCQDNAAMIAGLAYHRFQSGGQLCDPWDLESLPVLPLVPRVG